MRATPAMIGPSNRPSRVLTAKFSGECWGCGARYQVGDEIKYVGTGEIVATDCCGGEPPDVPASARGGEFAIEDDTDNEITGDAIARVMPRVVHPMCRTCFQIPSANRSCGCTE